jgi:hypothetical protein
MTRYASVRLLSAQVLEMTWSSEAVVPRTRHRPDAEDAGTSQPTTAARARGRRRCDCRRSDAASTRCFGQHGGSCPEEHLAAALRPRTMRPCRRRQKFLRDLMDWPQRRRLLPGADCRTDLVKPIARQTMHKLVGNARAGRTGSRRSHRHDCGPEIIIKIAHTGVYAAATVGFCS